MKSFLACVEFGSPCSLGDSSFLWTSIAAPPEENEEDTGRDRMSENHNNLINKIITPHVTVITHLDPLRTEDNNLTL